MFIIRTVFIFYIKPEDSLIQYNRLQQMWYKQQIEIAIIPRIFKGIKIAYKGDYFFKFQLVHQSQKGTRTSAYPYIFKPQTCQSNIQSHTNMQSAIKKSSKQQNNGKTIIQNNCGYYETNIIKITYQDQVEYFNQICIFKQEYKIKQKNKEGKVYLLIHMQNIRKNIIENQNHNNLLQINNQIQTIFTQKIYLNKNKLNINDFIQVQFNQHQYFGMMYMYIGSVHLGWKIRDNKMGLCQFLCLESNKKRLILQKHKKYINTKYQVGRCIKQITNNCIQNIQQFYKKTIKKSISEIFRLYKFYQYVTTYSQNNIQTITDQTQNFILGLVDFKFDQVNVYEYYESKDVNQVYFSIHHENNLLSDKLREIWQQMLSKIKLLTIRQFQKFVQRSPNIYQKIWKNSCVKFKANKRNKEQMLSEIQTESIISIAQNLKNKDVKNSHRIKQNIINQQLTKISRKNSGFFSPRAVNHLNLYEEKQPSFHKMRMSYIQKFKIQRKRIIQNQQFFYDQDYSNPLMIIQNYKQSKSVQRSQKFASLGLVVFIHGFKGSQFDLQKASEYLTIFNDGIQILLIRNIEHDVDYTIQQMAQIVALEIKKRIEASLFKFQSISIVGYSLGGIIGRAALPYLQQYRQKMNLFVTFSSPHLGTYASSNNLVRFGIWYMTKVSKNKVIEQLHTCHDLSTSTKSYLKILSQQKHISWFKKVVLLSCEQDQFVPHISSRIDQNIMEQKNHDKHQHRNKNQDIFKMQMVQMSQNIRKYAKRIQRIQVWFDSQNKKGTLDRLTGRTSHIQFLENSRFLRMFFQLYAKQF